MLIVFMLNVFDLKFTGKNFVNLLLVNVDPKIPLLQSQKTQSNTINWFVLKNGLFSKTMEVVKI